MQGLAATAADVDPPEVTIGERLFLETRFAQYFATHSNGNVNLPLLHGDPTLDQVQTTQGTMPGPFAGQLRYADPAIGGISIDFAGCCYLSGISPFAE